MSYKTTLILSMIFTTLVFGVFFVYTKLTEPVTVDLVRLLGEESVYLTESLLKSNDPRDMTQRSLQAQDYMRIYVKALEEEFAGLKRPVMVKQAFVKSPYRDVTDEVKLKVRRKLTEKYGWSEKNSPGFPTSEKN